MELLPVILVLTFLFSLIGTYFSTIIARKLDILDHPKSAPHRKLHTSAIPLMGATGFVVTASVATSLLWFAKRLDFSNLGEILSSGLNNSVSMVWVMVAIILLIIAGFLDDTNKIGHGGRFAIVGLALLSTVFPGGIVITALSFPFDTILPNILFLPQALGFLWIGFCLFATKVLDGHDGLVTSVGIVAFLSIASVSLFPNVNQPLLFALALVWATSLAGFLPFNFPHARVYLGDGGSMIIGYMIGLLSIMAGAKIATSSAVIGWFIIDILFVWLRRVLDRRNPLTSGDRFHWHQRLYDIGLNKIQVLTLTIGIIMITSSLGLIASTQYKAFIIAGQIIFLLLLFSITHTLTQKKKQTKPLS